MYWSAFQRFEVFILSMHSVWNSGSIFYILTLSPYFGTIAKCTIFKTQIPNPWIFTSIAYNAPRKEIHTILCKLPPDAPEIARIHNIMSFAVNYYPAKRRKPCFSFGSFLEMTQIRVSLLNSCFSGSFARNIWQNHEGRRATFYTYYPSFNELCAMLQFSLLSKWP